MKRTESKLDYVIKLLHHLAGGPRGSLGAMFGSGDEGDVDLPPYPHCSDSEFQSPDEFDPSSRSSSTRSHAEHTGSTENSELTNYLNAPNMMVTAKEFLWRLARQAALEKPWEIAPRFDNFDDPTTPEHHLSNCCGTLMELCHAGRENEWKAFSIQSWLYAGAWYLADARLGLKLGNDGDDMPLAIASFLSLVKVYWILLIVDQHPQKPLQHECGQDHRKFEQLQSLTSAFSAEIDNADLIMGRQPLTVITDTLESQVGAIWESDWTASQPEKDMFLAGFATSILECPPLLVVALKPAGDNLRRGKHLALC